MARWMMPLVLLLAACAESGPTVTIGPFGEVTPSPLANRLLADLRVTDDEIRLATDAAVECSTMEGANVGATVSEGLDGALNVGWEAETAQVPVVDRCFAANVRPLMAFRAWLQEGIEPEPARDLALGRR
jgi:hypothetical protein